MTLLLSSCGIRSWHTLVNESHYWPIHPIAYKGSSPTFTSSLLKTPSGQPPIRPSEGVHTPGAGRYVPVAERCHGPKARKFCNHCGYGFMGQLP
jgi:hypothetical protein